MCFRTALISRISAPELSSRVVIACFSASVTGGAGAGNSADAPPEITQMIRSRSPACSAIAAMRAAPRMPASSGCGWPHSFSSMRVSLAVWPYFALMRPPEMRLPSRRSTALAIAALAFPAPMTKIRSYWFKRCLRPATSSDPLRTRPRRRAPAQCQHGGPSASNGAKAFGDGGCFHVAKGGLAQIVEDAGDRALLKGFDLFVDVDEVPSETAGKQSSNGGFARAHESDQIDAGSLFEFQNH